MKSAVAGGKSKCLLLVANMLVDFCLGLLLARLLVQVFHFSSAHDLVRLLLHAMDTVVFYLRALIEWLMGAPAGLKLNSVLSPAIGKYVIRL